VVAGGVEGFDAQALSPSEATANAQTATILTNFTKFPLLSLLDAGRTL
jgi:hypothetical protein